MRNRLVIAALGFGAVSAMLPLAAAGAANSVPRDPVSVAPSVEPPNQDFLLAVASEAQDLAAGAFGNVRISIPDNTVDLYLADSPANAATTAVLESEYPNVISVHSARESYADAQSLEQRIDAARESIAGSGSFLCSVTPNMDGTLSVGFSTVAAGVSARLADLAGTMATAFEESDCSDVTLDAYRYSDTAPWNAGDLIRIDVPTDANYNYCTFGFGTHTASSGHHYLLTASHCWDDVAGQAHANDVYNAYSDDNFNDLGAKTYMGSLAARDTSISTVGATTTDMAQVDAGSNQSSALTFVSCWNCAGSGTVAGVGSNTVGQQVCTSGGYDGQVCGITVEYKDKTRCVPNGGCLYPAVEGWNTASGNQYVQGNGDSGGPVYSYSGSSIYAQGLISFHGGTSTEPCPIPGALAPNTRYCGTVGYWSDITADLARYGQVLNTG
jgi:hypothetical protein